nr:fibronectin type III domain-containing protein [Bacteroidota bacterium]
MIKNIILALMLISGMVQAQFQVGHTTINFVDSARSNRIIQTEIYYPAATTGNDVAVAGTTDKFPLVVFGHGFLMVYTSYSNIWQALVANGYIVALPRTEGNILPNHANFGKDLAFIANAFSKLNNTNTSLFYNKYSAQVCLSGHSMGGGAAMLAAKEAGVYNAVALLAPAQTNPTATAAAAMVNIPTMIIAGSNDCVTPANAHSKAIYDSSASMCKSYVSINGASHCQFANYNFNCSFGENTCGTPATITRDMQHQYTMKYLLPFLNYRLKNNCQAYFDLQDSIATSTDAAIEQYCINGVNCVAPPNRNTTNITSNSAKLKWKTPACYNNFEVRYKLNSAAAWITVGGTNGASFYNLNNLLAGTTYNWQVRAVCDKASTQFSPWSFKKTFTTASPRSSIEGQDDTDAKQDEITISPNPNHGKFELSCDNFPHTYVQFQVFDLSGNKILQKTEPIKDNQFKFQVDMTAKPRGIYVLQIGAEDILITERIVIK